MKEQDRTRNLLISIIVLVLYLVLLFNINNVGFYWGDAIIHIHPYVIALSPAIILFTIGISIYRRPSIVTTLFIWAGFYLVGTFLFFSSPGINKDNLFTVLLDLLVLSFSVIIAHWLVRNLAPDALAIKNNPALAGRYRVLEMSLAEPLIAAEIIRSRRYDYPVTVLAISLPDRMASPKTFLQRLSKNSKKMPRRIRYGITSILAMQDRQSDLIVDEINDGYVLLICPELKKGEQAKSVMQRIKNTVGAQLNIPISIGTSTFPSDDLTIEAVVDRAKKESVIDSANKNEFDEKTELG